MLFFIFLRNTLQNDIAIVRIAGGPIRFSETVKPACLPYRYRNTRMENLRDPWVVGWGAVDDGRPASSLLREVHK